MTFPQLLTAMEDALLPLAAAQGGIVEVAQSPEEAQKFLAAAPRRWRIIIHWEGFGNHDGARLGMTTHQLATVIQAPAGLLMRPGEQLTRPRPNGDAPFSTRMEQVRRWVAGMRFPNGCGVDIAGFVLNDSQWLPTVSGMGAHVFNWQLDAALPAFSEHVILNFPHLT